MTSKHTKITLKPIFFAVFAFFSLFFQKNLNAQCDSFALEIPYNSIDEDCDLVDGLRAFLPPFMYLVAGQEHSIVLRNTILSNHAQSYTYSVICPLPGVFDGKIWRLTPIEAQVGEYPITIQVKNPQGKTLASVSSLLRISSQTTPNFANLPPKKCIILGHSLVAQGVTSYYLRQLTDAVGTPNMSYHGTQVSFSDNETHHEGIGATSWRSFTKDSTSPLVFAGALNIRRYFDSVVCVGCNPDYFVIQLDVNDYCFTGFLEGHTFEEIRDYMAADYQKNILPLIQALRTTAPAMKIGVCLTPPANDRPGVFENFFAPGTLLQSRFRWKKIVNSIRAQYTEWFAGREKENISVIPIYLGVDDVEQFDDLDPVHPYPTDGNPNPPNGYRPIAKSVYGWLKYGLWRETQAASCALDATIFDTRCDDKGTLNNPADDEYYFSLLVQGQQTGSKWIATVGNLTVEGTYGQKRNLGPFPVNLSPHLMQIRDINNPLSCKTIAVASKEPCSNGSVAAIDLSMTARTPDTQPPLFSAFPLTFTVHNNSLVRAQNVWVEIFPPSEITFGSDPFVASQGTYDFFFSHRWDVGEIPANDSATLTLNCFLLEDKIFPFFGEVYSAFQVDLDSKPNNGNGTIPAEDDEAAIIFGQSDSKAVPEDFDDITAFPNPIRSGESLFFVIPNRDFYTKKGQFTFLDAQSRVIFQQNGMSASVVMPTAPGVYFWNYVLENGNRVGQRVIVLP